MNIGIRELRDGLSRHLASVRDGQVITVTDHGRPVARIVPIDRPSVVERLVAEGKVMPAARRKPLLSRPPAVGATVSDLVEQQRG